MVDGANGAQKTVKWINRFTLEGFSFESYHDFFSYFLLVCFTDAQSLVYAYKVLGGFFLREHKSSGVSASSVFAGRWSKNIVFRRNGPQILRSLSSS